MSLPAWVQPAPRDIRVAGALTALPGLAAVTFAIVLVVSAVTESTTTPGGNSVLGEAAYYAILGAGVTACGVGLLLGHTWARSPALVLALIVAALGWYMAGPSGRPLFGVPIIVIGLAVLVLLFRAPAREWAESDT